MPNTQAARAIGTGLLYLLGAALGVLLFAVALAAGALASPYLLWLFIRAGAEGMAAPDKEVDQEQVASAQTWDRNKRDPSK